MGVVLGMVVVFGCWVGVGNKWCSVGGGGYDDWPGCILYCFWVWCWCWVLRVCLFGGLSF